VKKQELEKGGGENRENMVLDLL